jgi:ribosomal-protein-alanine N-acetyltransferase
MMSLARAPLPLTITPYSRRYRGAVRDLLFRHENVLIHLDWQETEPWLDSSEAITRLAFDGHRLVGALAVSQPVDGAGWLRVAAVHDTADPGVVLPALWESLKPALIEAGIVRVAVLLLRDWIGKYVSALGFHFLEEVVTLRRGDQPTPSLMLPEGVTIRMLHEHDLARIAAVDRAAFVPPWQMSAQDVYHAVRIAGYCTVAQIGTQIVGYQLCTVYFDGAHLARLAVLPEMQGRGIGTALVSGAIQHFCARGIQTMTVNTQANNIQSQRVYSRLGFRRNGYDLPVWVAALP